VDEGTSNMISFRTRATVVRGVAGMSDAGGGWLVFASSVVAVDAARGSGGGRVVAGDGDGA